MNGEQASTELAVAIGRVEEGVKHLTNTQEKRDTNFTGFQLSTSAEFDKVHGRINKVDGRVTVLETTGKTNFKWLAAVQVVAIAVFTVGVNVVLRLLP